MLPGPHWRGSDWSIRPNTVLWLADLILTLICIGSQYRQSVIRTDHHPCSVTLGPNNNKAKTKHLCLTKCLLCVQSLCQSAIFSLFSISLSEALSKISSVIFNCYWLGIIQNKPIQFIFANNCTGGRIHKLRVALEEVAEKRLQNVEYRQFLLRLTDERGEIPFCSNLTLHLDWATLLSVSGSGLRLKRGKELAAVSRDVLIIIVNWQSVWELAHQGSTDLSPQFILTQKDFYWFRLRFPSPHDISIQTPQHGHSHCQC